MNFSAFNQTDHCLQFSCPERSVSPVYVLLYICAFAVCLLTVCGNLLVIISVCHFKQLHTPTNMLVLSLATLDLLYGIIQMPVGLIWMIESCWIFNRVFCIFHVLTAFFITNTSIYNVALIAVDRYFALSKPFHYANRVSVRSMCIVIISDWCLLFLYNLAVHYFNENFNGMAMCPGDCFVMFDEVRYLADLLFMFILPCALIIILYGQVFVIAKKHATAIRDINTLNRTKVPKKMESMKSERKAARVLGIVVSVFLACFLPYYIYSILGRVIEIDLKSFQKVLIPVYLNPAINPIIYALFYPWFRKSVKLILSRKIFGRDSSLTNVL